MSSANIQNMALPPSAGAPAGGKRVPMSQPGGGYQGQPAPSGGQTPPGWSASDPNRNMVANMPSFSGWAGGGQGGQQGGNNALPPGYMESYLPGGQSQPRSPQQLQRGHLPREPPPGYINYQLGVPGAWKDKYQGGQGGGMSVSVGSQGNDPLADLQQSDPSAYSIYMNQQNPGSGVNTATGSSSAGTYNFPQPGGGQQGNDLPPGYMESYLPGGSPMGGSGNYDPSGRYLGQPAPGGGRTLDDRIQVPPGFDLGQYFGGGGMSSQSPSLGVSTGGGSQPPGQPPPTPPNLGNDMIPGQPPGATDPFSQPTSAMDVYRSAVPVMKQDLTDRLSDAMASAGFSGNRFGSYAMNTAAQEGAKTGLQQNQLMTNLLHRQTNTDLDRTLQAANMGSQHGQAANQMQLDRMRFLADQGRFEQGRQDLFERQRYEDFERNKLGFLPMLMQMAQSPGSPTAGVWGNQQSGGSPGVLDWAQLAAQIYGASQ